MYLLNTGDKYTFTIEEGANGTDGRISVNYDGFVKDVSVGDILLIDGGLLTLKILSVDGKDVLSEVVDGGTMKSRCGCSSISCRLPSIWQAGCQPSCPTFVVESFKNRTSSIVNG